MAITRRSIGLLLAMLAGCVPFTVSEYSFLSLDPKAWPDAAGASPRASSARP